MKRKAAKKFVTYRVFSPTCRTGAPILLLDEATSALDAATEKRVLQNLRDLGGKTVFFITHKSAAVEIADAIVTIKNGEVFIDERA